MGLIRWSGTGKEPNWKISDKEVLGRRMWVATCECASESSPNLWILIREQPKQRRFLIIRCTSWSVSWTPVNLSSQLPQSLPSCLYEQSGQRSKGGDYTWAQQYRLLRTKADLPSATAEDVSCQQQRIMMSSQYGTTPWWVYPVVWWHVDYTGSALEVLAPQENGYSNGFIKLEVEKLTSSHAILWLTCISSSAGYMHHWKWEFRGSERLTSAPVHPHRFQLIPMDVVCPYSPLLHVYLSFPENLPFWLQAQ